MRKDWGIISQWGRKMDNKYIDELLYKISTGDNKAFEELYLKTRKGVFSFLYSYLQNYHDAEDAMQSVYLRIKRFIHSYTQGTNGLAWILQIAKNFALTELKRNKPTQELDSLPEPSYDFEYNSITEVMKKTLDEDEYRIVTLHVLWGYKHREIGKELGMPTGTVTSKYKRAIEKLRKVLKEEV